MRKVVAAVFLSLDGVMQAPGGPDEDRAGGFAYGGWTVPYWDDAMRDVMGATFAQPFDLLLGRKTYEIFAAHWPSVGAGDPIGDVFNKVTKYVATSSTKPLTWTNSQALGRDVAGAVARLKQEEGPSLLIQGSSEIVQALLTANLIDEFTLLVFPVILGPGKRFFGSGAVPAALEARSTSMSSTGVIMTRYQPAGPVRTGSFALEQPTEAEIARREGIAREG